MSSLAVIDFLRDWVSYDPAAGESQFKMSTSAPSTRKEKKWAERKRFRETIVNVMLKIGPEVIRLLLSVSHKVSLTGRGF
jgi:hypothetical protein